jgi:hypothetical protein
MGFDVEGRKRRSNKKKMNIGASISEELRCTMVRVLALTDWLNRQREKRGRGLVEERRMESAVTL